MVKSHSKEHNNKEISVKLNFRSGPNQFARYHYLKIKERIAAGNHIYHIISYHIIYHIISTISYHIIFIHLPLDLYKYGNSHNNNT